MKKSIAIAVFAAVSALFSGAQAFAQQKPVELPMGEALAQIEGIRTKVLDRDKLDSEFPPAFWSKRDDAKSQCLRAIQLSALAGEIEFVSKAANLEEDSKIRRSWFKEVASVLAVMSVERRKMEDALENKSRTDYFKALNSYMKSRVVLEELLEPKNRPVLNEEELKKVKEERKRAQKAGQ